MARPKPPTQTALEAHAQAMAAMQAHLLRLQEIIIAREAFAAIGFGGNISWGHVADVQHANGRLAEVLAFLDPPDEA